MLIPAWMIGREEGNVQRRMEPILTSFEHWGNCSGSKCRAIDHQSVAWCRFRNADASIDRLERDLRRIDSDRAWDYFNADTNSAVISRYTRIYIEGSNHPVSLPKQLRWCLGR